MITRDAYVLGSARIPFVKSMTNYVDVKLQDLMTAALQGLVNSMKLDGQLIGDVALGAIISSSTNWNLARESVLGTTLDPHTPAYNVQRACGTGLETVLQIALKISNYQIDTGIAGGCDSNSDLPIGINKALTKKIIALHGAKSIGDKLKVIATLRPSDLQLVYPAVIYPVDRSLYKFQPSNIS
jgi:acetyl-CoA C-acetyltransferase